MTPEKQLNLYSDDVKDFERERFSRVDEKVLDNALLEFIGRYKGVKVVEDKKTGEFSLVDEKGSEKKVVELSVPDFDKIIAIFYKPEDSSKKLKIEDLSSFLVIIQRFQNSEKLKNSIALMCDMSEIEKVVKERTESVRKGAIREINKEKKKEKWGIEKSLPTGDKD